MNKLGLASLDELELSDAAMTAGFWKPPEMLPLTRTYVTLNSLHEHSTKLPFHQL